MLLTLKNNILKLNNNWKFESIIAIVFVAFGIIGWQSYYIIGAIPIILLSIFLILFSNKFKYSIPAILTLLFSYNNGFELEQFPYEIVIPIAIYVLFIVVFSLIKLKKADFKKIRYTIGMSILAIAFIIPIFWATEITDKYTIFYVMYFSWLIYLLVYVALCILIEKDSFKTVNFTFSFLPLLITYELAITLYKWHLENPTDDIFEFWSYIGWGLCNEAGIVICLCLPFIFYSIIKAESKRLSILFMFVYLIAIFGVLITMARGSYLCAFLISISFFIVLVFKKNENRWFKISFLVTVGILALIPLFIHFGFIELFDKTVMKVFVKGFDVNGRDEIWEKGYNSWSSAGYKMIFGSGIVSEIKTLKLYHGVQESFIVYHSTTLEVLVSSGIIGLVGLGIHLAEKYMMLFRKKEKVFTIVFFVGYLMVDLYGLIDNTYGMYYYMVPLCIIMATINNCSDTELFKNNEL